MKNFLTYDELKKTNRKAHSALISLWEELSRTSRETARKDLKENLGTHWTNRYHVYGEHSGGQYTYTFKDNHSGDLFHYSKDREQWC